MIVSQSLDRHRASEPSRVRRISAGATEGACRAACRASASLVVTSTCRGSKAIARPRNATSLRTLARVRNRGTAGGPVRKDSARSRAPSAAAVATRWGDVSSGGATRTSTEGTSVRSTLARPERVPASIDQWRPASSAFLESDKGHRRPKRRERRSRSEVRGRQRPETTTLRHQRQRAQ